MKVYLQQHIPGLGKANQIVDVSEAYARNYLLPKRLAGVATPVMIEQAAKRRLQALAQGAQQMAQLAHARQTLTDQTIRLKGKTSPSDRLFAAIKESQITAAAAEQFHVDMPEIKCQPNHLKTVGTHRVDLLWPDGQHTGLTVIVDAAG